MIRSVLGIALSAALISACATAPRMDSPLASPRGAAPVGFPTYIRTETTDTDFLKEIAITRQQALAKAADRTVDILALSGGGAGGAFGAGVLIGLCFAPVKAIAFNPLLGLPIALAWVIVGSINRLYAVPAALAAFVAVLAFGVDIRSGSFVGGLRFTYRFLLDQGFARTDSEPINQGGFGDVALMLGGRF